MNEKDILHKVADTILDNPIELTVDIKVQSSIHGWLQRVGICRKVAKFHIYGTTLTNMIRISDQLLDVDVQPIREGKALEWSYSIVSKEAKRMAEIIAIAIHNRKDNRPDSLVKLILNNFSSTELKQVSGLVLDRLNMPDFISSIASVRTMNILEASPMRPEIIAEPTVISGEQLGDVSNIFATAKIM